MSEVSRDAFVTANELDHLFDALGTLDSVVELFVEVLRMGGVSDVDRNTVCVDVDRVMDLGRPWWWY